MDTTIIVILVALLLSAFFSGMEIAFLSSNKLLLEIERKQSRTYNRIASLFLKSPGQYISTILVGNNIALVIYSIFMSSLYFELFGKPNYAIETLITTLIIIFTAEFLPKAVVRANPNFYLRIFAVPLYLFYIFFYPLSRVATGASTLVLRVFGKKIETRAQTTNFGKVDLATLVEEVTANEEENEEAVESADLSVKLFHNALEFSEQRVRECMVPRTEMEAIDVESSIIELKQLFMESGYSRLAIYEGTIDNIIGYVSIKSMFRNPENIRDILQETIYAPESMLQQKLLSEFIRTSKSIAIVIDEFGSTAGMVTIEDLLEQIFGEIEDEHDDDSLVERKVGEGEYILAGRFEVEYLNETYDLGIPESDRYDTLAGYILNLDEDIPQAGEVIHTDDGFKIKILRTGNAKIELVQITKVKQK